MLGPLESSGISHILEVAYDDERVCIRFFRRVRAVLAARGHILMEWFDWMVLAWLLWLTWAVSGPDASLQDKLPPDFDL